ncbi:uncharacterized protein MYCFIDRAFT_210681 [Pseudocercospora fijiensis CIRAD86]|uniref:Uncharacterized protein n=1 Tax=Pseudocercospora fijiensis (strain CIRAD86) TaxID=383855 RepID=M3A7K4_PSEFD|nr:uncharacterized protein MYCFIDRAFT_210681 [Pseudocercospora fijiensis CIRAD86]EME87064.1 hypothetical protein MYCFIDRAFT_210681 [Pseudocercospora fijiensis CIRAD86]
MFSSIINLLAVSAMLSLAIAAPTPSPISNNQHRQAAEVVGATVEVAEFIMDVVSKVQDAFNEAYDQASQFTQDTVVRLAAKYPTKNILMYHDQDSTYKLYGAQHQHVEFDLAAPLGTMGYEIWIFDHGTFQRAGDGGYLNWAYIGNATALNDDGGVQFYLRQ